MAHKLYKQKLLFRGLLVGVILITYLLFPENFYQIAFYNIAFGITPVHIIWFILIVEMLIVFIPGLNNYVSCGKHLSKHYIPNPEPYDREELRRHTIKMNKASIGTVAVWLLFLIIIAFLYKTNTITEIDIILVVFILYFCDQVCINIWCPFQSFIMKCKCCNTCRIFNWGHFMIFSPLVYVRDPYAPTLLLLSFFIFIQWEYLHYKYPQRFSEISNLALRCNHCKDPVCSYKRQLSKDFGNYNRQTSRFS
jgi:hypothetical protein